MDDKLIQRKLLQILMCVNEKHCWRKHNQKLITLSQAANAAFVFQNQIVLIFDDLG